MNNNVSTKPLTKGNNMSNIRIYACGGAGVNTVGEFDTGLDPSQELVDICYADTSTSNLKQHHENNKTFIVEGLDGCGSIRSDHHDDIFENINKLLVDFKPCEMNIVVFSAGGGSGSVFGPLIASELLNRQENVICLVIGSHESGIKARNTLNTLKSLESISSMRDTPLVMFYEHNDRSRSTVNQSINLALNAIALLASGKNHELDSKDVSNWLRFDKTAGLQPCLANLQIFNDGEKASQSTNPISIASLYASEDNEVIQATPDYSCAGYMPQADRDFDELHYIVSIDILPKISVKLNETIAKYEEQSNARPTRQNIVSDKDNVNKSGLVV